MQHSSSYEAGIFSPTHKIHLIYVTRSSTVLVTVSRHVTPHRGKLTQSTPSHCIKYPTIYAYVFQIAYFLQGFPTKSSKHFCSPIRVTRFSHFSLISLIILIIFSTKYKIKKHRTVQLSALFIPSLWFRNHQDCVLEYCQPVFWNTVSLCSGIVRLCSGIVRQCSGILSACVLEYCQPVFWNSQAVFWNTVSLCSGILSACVLE